MKSPTCKADDFSDEHQLTGFDARSGYHGVWLDYNVLSASAEQRKDDVPQVVSSSVKKYSTYIQVVSKIKYKTK